MVANSIAFFLATIFLASGIYGFYRIGQRRIPEDDESKYLIACFLCVVVAWFCAKLGGI